MIKVFKKAAYFNVKRQFVYEMKIHNKYERTFLSKEYAHNATQFGKKEKFSPMMMSPTTKARIYCHHTL
jgi:hypothetical protein